MTHHALSLVLIVASVQPLCARIPANSEILLPAKTRLPAATHANVRYGADARQILDFWQTPATRPTGVVIYFHGGAWVRGDKSQIIGLDKYLSAGISVVSVNYRFVWEARAAGIKPPVQWPMHDSARAVQFVRSRAAEWNIDASRIALAGDSAGACNALWVALHPDRADPASSDIVARQSTKVVCVALVGAQTTLDPTQMKTWTPNSFYGGHAFGFIKDDVVTDMGNFETFLAAYETIKPWIREYSPYALATAEAPPVYLLYRAAPNLGHEQKDPTHTANFGVMLQEKLRGLGVECEVAYPGAERATHAQMHEFLIERLAAPAATKSTQ